MRVMKSKTMKSLHKSEKKTHTKTALLSVMFRNCIVMSSFNHCFTLTVLRIL